MNNDALSIEKNVNSLDTEKKYILRATKTEGSISGIPNSNAGTLIETA